MFVSSRQEETCAALRLKKMHEPEIHRWLSTVIKIALLFALVNILELLSGYATIGAVCTFMGWNSDAFHENYKTIKGLLLSVNTLIYSGVLLGILLSIPYRIRQEDLLSYLRLRSPVKFKVVLLWVAGLIVIHVSELFVQHWLHSTDTSWFEERYSTADSLPLLFLAVCVFGPLAEEIIYRGFLFNFLENRPWLAVVIPSALWATAHTQYPADAIGFIFLDGLYYGLARKSTGSLRVPYLLHAMGNFYSFFVLFWYQ
jgi:membrane protease YdiL (CAAX protease family)